MSEQKKTPNETRRRESEQAAKLVRQRVANKQTPSATTTRGGTRDKQGQPRSADSRPKPPQKSGVEAAKPRAPRKKNTPSKQTLVFSAQQKALMLGAATIFFNAILLLSLISPQQGKLTTALAKALWTGFGWGGYFVPVALGLIGFYAVLWGMEQPPRLSWRRWLGVSILFVAGLALATNYVQWREPLATAAQIAQRQIGGGYLGGILAWMVSGLVGTLGSGFLFTMLALIGLFLATGWSREQVAKGVKGVIEKVEQRPRRSAELTPSAQPRRARLLEKEDRSAIKKEGEVAESADQLVFSRPNPTSTPESADDEARLLEVIRKRRQAGGQSKGQQSAEPPLPTTLTHNNGAGQWELPDFATILRVGSSPESNEQTIQDQANTIERTLESFGAPAKIVDLQQGPTVTQFGVEPMYIEARSGKRLKVKVSKIASLADDLALALAAKSVRVEAPVPGKGYIGIEVPNPHQVVVSLRDIMEAESFQRLTSPLRIGLGQDVAGNPISADLAKMPHLLVAGATGSGKSVCVNGIIACLLLQNTPDQLRFVMVDPKRVELTGYNGIPHLAAPVVVEMDRVVGVLQWALREMDQRYQTFAQVGVRNIAAYNKKMEKDEKPTLPYIVIIIDELADLMMTAPEETERALARLAQMARATGMHMIIATQRPSVDVVTGLIKANFPARIAFAVSSSTDSRVVLDTVGAERLLGAGDMLFQKPDAPAPIRAQGCFVSDEELNQVIRYWQSARRFHRYTADSPTTAGSTPNHHGSMPAPLPETKEVPALIRPTNRPNHQPAPLPIVNQKEREAEVAPDAPPQSPLPPQPPLWEALINLEAQKQENGEDELREEAIAFVRKVGKASTSLLQRRFRIGYTRAARLIDEMEEAGVIGAATGTSRAREVIGHQVREEESEE